MLDPLLGGRSLTERKITTWQILAKMLLASIMVFINKDQFSCLLHASIPSRFQSPTGSTPIQAPIPGPILVVSVKASSKGNHFGVE